MLYELYVENFAIIGKMRLSLSPGVNALSGETGAGKSLVVDAVSLLIGGRGNDSFIRSGYDRCLIEGLFTPPFTEELGSQLERMGFDSADDTVVLSRELSRGGRNICRVNGRAVNLTQLRTLGRLLLNIHGQMEHMLLLDDDQQLRLLDSYGGAELMAAKARVAELFAVMRDKQAFVRDYEQNKEQRLARLAQLSEQIEELEQAALKPGEEEELREEARRLNYAEKLISLASQARRHLADGDGAVESAGTASSLLREAARLDETAQPLAERLEALYYEAEDIGHELAVYISSVDTDAYRLEGIESRLAELGRLKKKYRGGEDELLLYLQQARAEHAALDELDFSGVKSAQAAAAAEAAYEQEAASLSERRAAAAAALGEAVSGELHRLCMTEAMFRVDLPRQEPAASGREKALFMIRTNAGEDFGPVAKIASGGELSRVVLAMKVILAQLDSVPTLVFDEVDSGLGGQALNAVAQRLAYVGQSNQVIVVTHAAAMAAAAERQLHVAKHVAEGRTEMAVRELTYEERVDELARMIAGEHITDTTRRQAAELLDKAGKTVLF